LRPGKRTGFSALYRQHGDQIYRFCFRLSGSVSDAEDLTQEVFLAAFQGQEKFQGRSSVQTWLYKISLNCWRQSRRKPQLDTAPLEETAQSGPDLAQTVTDQIALTCALSVLPPNLRETFLLVRAEGLTYREAAQILDIPQGTVQWRVHEASRRLRALLAEEGER
jgi:RNA polymerase sigma-70 factor (ECF subfamily)